MERMTACNPNSAKIAGQLSALYCIAAPSASSIASTITTSANVTNAQAATDTQTIITAIENGQIKVAPIGAGM